MRTSVAAVAVIARVRSDGVREWLTQWNDKWQSLNLIGGQKTDDESFRECCEREVIEELELKSKEFALSPGSMRLDFDAWSQSAQTETHYHFEIFVVSIDHDALKDNPANCWVTEAEVRAEKSADGTPISATVLRVLTASGLCQ
jgi:NUDIX domain